MSGYAKLTTHEVLFASHIPLFVDNRERILASPEMAGVLAGVRNGLAYSGAFKPVSVGTYLEWWKNVPDLSHDKQGRLIWKVSGSQLSGIHACQSVDENGTTHPAELNVNLVVVARSFLDAPRFPESKITLPQLIETLTNG